MGEVIMAYCEQTRRSFEGLITKPTLSDKLLQRPPFQFIHDVVSATIKAKPFLRGLFPAEHMNGKTMKDKDVKLAYLTPLINAVQFGAERKLDVKAAKIIAGQEAEQTNLLLQALAAAARSVDEAQNEKIVERVLGGETFEGPGSAGSNKENRKEKKKSKSKERTSSKEKVTKKKSTESTTKRESSKEKSPKKKSKRTVESATIHDEGTPKSDEGLGSSSREPSATNLVTDPDIDATGQPRSPPRPGTSMGGRPVTSMGRPGTSLGGRPGTARPAPPRIKRKELGTKVDAAEASGAPAETANIIAPATDGDEGEEEFVVEQSPEDEALGPTLGAGEEKADADELDAAEHGGLVRKILETKKDLESGLAEGETTTGTVLIFDEAERRRAKAETAKMQQSIQSLTRSAHPLAALLDYMQEDVESMTRELESWRVEQRNNNEKLKQMQASRADPATEQLRAKLAELDAQIGDATEGCAALRTKIVRNEEHIDRLVKNITHR